MFSVPSSLLLPARSGRAPRALRLLPEFVSAAEAAALLQVVEPQLARRRYERGHWDGVIRGYRECQLPVAALQTPARHVIERSFDAVLPPGAKAQTSVHVLDLADDPAAGISFHIDSVKFSGRVVAGISLLSDAVMQLRYEPPSSPLRAPADAYGAAPATGAAPVGSDEDVLSMLLPQRSCYVLIDDSRYEWSHAVLGGTTELRAPVDRAITRRRRVSIVMRDELA